MAFGSLKSVSPVSPMKYLSHTTSAAMRPILRACLIMSHSNTATQSVIITLFFLLASTSKLKKVCPNDSFFQALSNGNRVVVKSQDQNASNIPSISLTLHLCICGPN